MEGGELKCVSFQIKTEIKVRREEKERQGGRKWFSCQKYAGKRQEKKHRAETECEERNTQSRFMDSCVLFVSACFFFLLYL